MGGRRAALVFFDLQDQSDMPVAGEGLFDALDANITLSPVMRLKTW
jgi:hypothetical protein